MASKIDIISNAFLLLGQGAVNNIGETAPQHVKDAVNLYDMFYTSYLASYPWSFCLKQFTLNRLTSFTQISGYTFAYQLPSGWLSIYRVDPLSDYMIVGDLIYSNTSDPFKIFASTYVDESKLPVYYVAYLVEQMAAVFAMPMTQNPNIAMEWGQSALKKLGHAKQLNNANEPSPILRSNPVAQAHYLSNTGL